MAEGEKTKKIYSVIGHKYPDPSPTELLLSGVYATCEIHDLGSLEDYFTFMGLYMTEPKIIEVPESFNSFTLKPPKPGISQVLLNKPSRN